MKEIIDKGHAEEVEDHGSSNDNGHLWYIPHHGVYHRKKSEKIRFVLDCSELLEQAPPKYRVLT